MLSTVYRQMSSSRGLKFIFSVGELVLCFEPDPTKARVLYDAKVLDCQVTKDKHGRKASAYHIHFQGWNSSWDRIVYEDHILKNTDENKSLMKKLADTANKFPKIRHSRHRIDDILKDNGKIPAQDSDSANNSDDSDNDNNGDTGGRSSDEEDSTASETRERRRATHTPIDIDIPEILKSRLEDDYGAVNHSSKITKLPVRTNVVKVLEGFMKTFCVNLLCEPSEKEKESRRLNDHTLLCPIASSVTLCKEFVDGLRICFNFSLPIILLYNSERKQYEHVMKNMKVPELDEEILIPCPEASLIKKARGASYRRGSYSEDADEYSPRRATRSSINSDDSLPSKAERKKGERGRPVIKAEPVSDSENGETEIKSTVADNKSKDGSEQAYRREDFLESVLSWQLLAPEAKIQYPITPSQIYGINHFLRMFVKLPEILNRMAMEECKMRSLMKLVHHLLRYLVERQEDLFEDVEYEDRKDFRC